MWIVLTALPGQASSSSSSPDTTIWQTGYLETCIAFKVEKWLTTDHLCGFKNMLLLSHAKSFSNLLTDIRLIIVPPTRNTDWHQFNSFLLEEPRLATPICTMYSIQHLMTRWVFHTNLATRISRSHRLRAARACGNVKSWVSGSVRAAPRETR